jgi:LemA protein
MPAGPSRLAYPRLRFLMTDTMGPFLIFLGILLVGLLVLAVIVVGMYNGLVTLRNAFRNAFAQVDVQLKRRHDLIPNLVETAKGYMAHESGTLTAVIEARAKATQANVRFAGNPNDPAAMRDLAQAESGLSGALGKLMVVSENYPELKADATMRTLMEELASTENRIAFSRQAFNDSVQEYNTSREVFPNVFVANSFGFLPAELFKIENDVEKVAPTVKF